MSGVTARIVVERRGVDVALGGVVRQVVADDGTWSTTFPVGAGSATVTTVESRKAIPEARTVAVSIHRAAGVPHPTCPPVPGTEVEPLMSNLPAGKPFGGLPTP